MQPPQTHVWKIEPHMDYLDEDNEVPNPGGIPDPTYAAGSSVGPDPDPAITKKASEQ